MANERTTISDTERLVRRSSLKEQVRFLYEAHRGFRIGMATFDIATVTFFLVTTFLPMDDWILWIDYGICAVLLMDLAARFWTARDRKRFAFSVWTAIDVVVIFSMTAPMFFANYSFLRVMRTVRLLRSYAVLRDLRRRKGWFAQNGEMLLAGVNLLVFIFIVSAFVYVGQAGKNPNITNYVDTVYFTVTTLTTTGFGDITLIGTNGRFLAILVMLLGVGLFLRFVQALFRPNKAHVECPACGLSRHDFDAVHCKHCGAIIHITNEGPD